MGIIVRENDRLCIPVYELIESRLEVESWGGLSSEAFYQDRRAVMFTESLSAITGKMVSRKQRYGAGGGCSATPFRIAYRVASVRLVTPIFLKILVR